jgi:hypothetical protein
MFLGEIFNTAGKVIGAAVGTVVGLSAITIGTALGITTSMAQEALDAGCKTYEEIKNFHRL